MEPKRNKNIAGVVISEDVIAKMVGVAALEIDGVAAVVPKPADIKGVFRDKSSQAVHVRFADNEIYIDAYLKLKSGAKIISVCEAVQENVKSQIQNMTGRAVAKVNVFVVDVDLGDVSAEK